MTSPEQQHTGGLRGAINDLLGRGRDERGVQERDTEGDLRDDGLGRPDRLDRSGAEDAGVAAPGGHRHGGAEDAGVEVPGRAAEGRAVADPALDREEPRGEDLALDEDPALDRFDGDDTGPASEPRHSLREDGPVATEHDGGQHDLAHGGTAADAIDPHRSAARTDPRTDREQMDMERTDTELAHERGAVDGGHLGAEQRLDEGRLDEGRADRGHLEGDRLDTDRLDGGAVVDDRREADRLDAEPVHAGTAERGPVGDAGVGDAATTTAGTGVAGTERTTAHAATGAGVAGTGAAAAATNGGETPARLVSSDRADSYTGRWNEVKGMFVDEPRQAVGQADALVGELLDELQNLFTKQRQSLEHGLDNEETSTEDLRVALRRYRSFFDRLLAI